MFGKRSVTTRTALALWLALAASWAQAVELPDFTRLAERTKAVVVNVSATAANADAAAEPGEVPELPPGAPLDELLRKFFEDRQGDGFPGFERDSLGSGFIVSADGYIITNQHVVRGGGRIVVRLSDRREFDADVVGNDPNSDIALLKIEATDLPVARIGDSGKLKVGEWVMAVGSPFGFEHSVTVGVVSAKGRALPNENYVPFIQTDVAINPGNSGGPLFNLDGEVVGVNSQIFSRTGGYMGLSFAIPSNVAMDVVEQLKASGTVSRGWLGVYIQDVTRDLAESFAMDTPRGALVAQVLEDGPAAKAGLQPGDVIVEFNGEPVEHSAALPPLVGATPAGSEVPVEVIRSGRTVTLNVVLGELPEQPAVASQPAPSAPPAPPGNERLGISVAEPDAAMREALDLEQGAVIVRSIADGPAARSGLQEGDAIVMIQGVRIRDVEHFNEVVKSLEPGSTVPTLVHRRGGPLFLPLKIPAP